MEDNKPVKHILCIADEPEMIDLTRLILERRGIVGGARATEEIHPGFHVSTLSYACGLFRPEIKEELQLAKFGLEEHVHDPALFLPFPDRRYILWRPEAAWNLREVAKFSEADAKALSKYDAFWEEFAEMVEPTLLAPPVSLADLAQFVTTPEAEVSSGPSGSPASGAAPGSYRGDLAVLQQRVEELRARRDRTDATSRAGAALSRSSAGTSGGCCASAAFICPT